MSIFDGNMPYTNLHDLNLDWIVQKIKYWDSNLEKLVTESANEYFESIMANTLYDEQNMKIVLDFSGGDNNG